jgi:hypothetical protein
MAGNMLSRRRAQDRSAAPFRHHRRVVVALWFLCCLVPSWRSSGNPSSTHDRDRPTPSIVEAAAAFAPTNTRSGRSRQCEKKRLLHLFLQRQLPTPPPPPPSLLMPDDGSSFFSIQDVTRQLSEALDRIDLSQIQSKVASLTSSLPSLPSSTAPSFDAGSQLVQSLQERIRDLDAQILSQLSNLADALGTSGDGLHPTVQLVVGQLQALLAPVLAGTIPQFVQGHPTFALLLSSLISYVVVSSFLSGSSSSDSDSYGSYAVNPQVPYPDGRYDPDAARRYFDKRLPEVIGRAAEIAVLSASFGLRILQDYSKCVRCRQTRGLPCEREPCIVH